MHETVEKQWSAYTIFNLTLFVFIVDTIIIVIIYYTEHEVP